MGVNEYGGCVCTYQNHNECSHHQMMTEPERLRDIILDELDQAYNEFIFYQRKLDKRLPLDAVERAIVTKLSLLKI